MAEQSEQQVDDTAPAEPAAAPADAAPTSDNIDAALAEFDSATSTAIGPTLDELLAPADAEPVQQNTADVLRHQEQLHALRQGGELSQRRADMLEMALREQRQADWLRAEAVELNKLVAGSVAEMQESFPDLPAAFVEAWWNSKALTDPKARDYWDNRAQYPIRWRNYETRMKAELFREAQMRPDPDATADRHAIVQAVRGASARSAPAEAPAHLGRMSNAEYRKHIMDKHGFDPLT